MRVWRLVPVMGALICQTLVLGTAPAGAATVGPDQQGWWSEAQPSPPVPPLPVNTVTGTNLQVGNDPSGPDAVAAVRYTVPGTVDGIPVDPSTVPATLTLKVAPNTAVGTPTVVACPVLGSWQPAQGGDWAAKPAYSCAASTPATLSTDGQTATFALTTVLQARAGVYDLALVPDPANQLPFQVQFLAPGGDSLTLGSGAASLSAVTEPPPPLDLGPGLDTGTVGPLPETTPFVSAPLSEPVTPPPATAAARQPTVALRPEAPALIGHISSKRAQRAVALGVLLAMVAAVWWFGGQPVRSPRLLGPLGGRGGAATPGVYVRAGGIGRFARPRAKPPTRL